MHFCCGSQTHPVEVGDDGGPVLQAGGAVLELGALLGEQLTHETADPSGLAVDEEDLSM